MGAMKELQIELMDRRDDVVRLTDKEPEEILSLREALWVLRMIEENGR